MSERKNVFGWVIAGVFLAGLVVLNAVPPDSSELPWNDPFLIIIGVAIVYLCFMWAKDRWQVKRALTSQSSRTKSRRKT